MVNFGTVHDSPRLGFSLDWHILGPFQIGTRGMEGDYANYMRR